MLRLQSELGEAQAKLAELKRRGTPISGYTNHTVASEQEVSSIANNLLHRLTEDAAKRTFRVSANRLSPDTRKDLELQFRGRHYVNFESLGLYPQLPEFLILRQQLREIDTD